MINDLEFINMDLSIIILSFNTRDITDECLRRLQSSVDSCQTKLKNKIQVIVLDNASSDGSVEMIKNRIKQIATPRQSGARNDINLELIESKENTGYSKGNNIAFQKTKYPLVLFLNSDVFVEADSIEKAIKYFIEHNCDILGIKLRFENGTFQPSGGFLPNPLNVILWILGIGQIYNPFHPKSKSFFEKEREVGWVMGAFFMIKKQVFEKLKGFDEDIFMYMDEVDLCKRAKIKGFKVCFTPSVEVIHLHRASSKDNPENAFTRELTGIKYYFEKYYPKHYPFTRVFLFLGLILRILAFSLLGKINRAKAYARGLKVV